MFKPLCEAAPGDTAGNGATPSTKKVREVEAVTLTDGRIVEFVGKRKMLKESFPEGIKNEAGEVLIPGPLVRLDFRNGETRSYKLGDSLLIRFATHGAEQKLGDETAGEEDVDDMVLAVDGLIDRLNNNEWSIAREAGGMSGTSILLKALVEFSPSKTLDQLKEFLKGRSQAEKIALRNSAKLKPIVDRLETEKAAKGAKVDTDALLGGLA